uniref:Uncharacterized protein n=1 Tax=Arundo donax TaxID=35708 RepID=A0A0A8Y632_ARUDO
MAAPPTATPRACWTAWRAGGTGAWPSSARARQRRRGW